MKRTNVILIVVAAVGALSVAHSQEPPKRVNADEQNLPRPLREKHEDARRVPVAVIATFHSQLNRLSRDVVPKIVQLRYMGDFALARCGPTEEGGLVIRGQQFDLGPNLDNVLDWCIENKDDEAIAWVSLSTRQRDDTIGVTRLEGFRVFVNVPEVMDGKAITDKLPELGDRSLLAYLKKLELEPVKPLVPTK